MSAEYLAWQSNALLMSTENGLMLWTHAAHRLGHVFIRITDDALWEWGY